MNAIDLDELSLFAHREASLLSSALLSNGWTKDTCQEWETHGHQYIMAFCVQDDHEPAHRRAAVSAQRRHLTASLVRFDNHTCKQEDNETIQKELEDLQKAVGVECFMNHCEQRYQRMVQKTQQQWKSVVNTSTPFP